MSNGWTLSTRSGLKYVLTNPMYAGHLVFNGRIVKYNAHPAIVDADNWQFAFDHLAKVDLEGQPIERNKRAVRYTQHLTNGDSGALLAGTRESGKLVIDGVNKAHVYIQMPGSVYAIRQLHGLSATGYETSISIKELDAIIEARLLHWLRAVDRQHECNQKQGIASPYETTSYHAMGKVEQNTQAQPKGTVQDDLTLTNQKLARIERRLRTSEDVMSDEDVREAYDSKARLIKRRTELKQAIEQGERLARQREQAKEDIETAASKWAKWSIEKRRSFIRLVTESVTLEEIAHGWLRLVITWSPIMGFVYPMASSMRAVEIAYIWRQSGDTWSNKEKDLLRANYPTMPRSELLRIFPSRSWTAISKRAMRIGVRRLVPHNHNGTDVLDIPIDTSLTDLAVVNEFMLEPNKRIQWQHVYRVQDQIINGDDRSVY